jgi:hypothetical protein
MSQVFPTKCLVWDEASKVVSNEIEGVRIFGSFYAGAKVMNMHKKLGFLFCFLTAQTSTDEICY